MERSSAAAPDERESFVVVVNDEGQHSVWWADRDPPSGWFGADVRGTQAECLERIAATWTDMRPSSLLPRPPAEAHGAHG